MCRKKLSITCASELFRMSDNFDFFDGARGNGLAEGKPVYTQ